VERVIWTVSALFFISAVLLDDKYISASTVSWQTSWFKSHPVSFLLIWNKALNQAHLRLLSDRMSHNANNMKL
jgi:hypothetical protein